MNEKRAVKIIILGFAAALCISFGIIFHDSSDGDTYVVINSGSELETGSTAIPLALYDGLRLTRT